ncbi:MAG: hypothetical protein ACI9HK_003743 [Pirellulaceae bacterium]|jgi:hypothetical protein
MSCIVVLLALGISPGETGEQAEKAEPRPYHVISKEIHDALRREATVKDSDQHAEAVFDLTELHTELVSDPRYSTSDTLKEYRAKIWSRLRRVKKSIEVRLAREGKRVDVEAVAEVIRDASYATSELSSHLDLVSSTVGGPAKVFTAGQAGGKGVSDHGPALVDLIERTINPEFWDSAGGPGSIFYFQPLHALVVSATAEVHENLGGVLQGLRRAGN